jgi:pyruvate/2-oxoglutarate dehydrogenase complex dihydrolipoamide dehydrogenase (E3) component
LPLETSRPGVFAVGDVRSGSAKRVAAAVGEGAMAIRLALERTEPAYSALTTRTGDVDMATGREPGQ